MSWNTAARDKNVEDKRNELKLIEEFWINEKLFTTKMSDLISSIHHELDKHAENLSKIIELTDRHHIDVKTLQQFIGAIRFLSNGFELSVGEIKVSCEGTDNVLQRINKMSNLLSDTGGSDDETIFSTYHSFMKKLTVLAPEHFLNVLKTFESLFSVGNSYFLETLFLKETEKKLTEKNEVFNKEGGFVSYTGKTIKEILTYEGRGMNQLPKALSNIIDYLNEKGCYCKGIFRESQNASVRKVEELSLRMSVTNFSELPCDVVANVLKKFLRNLPVRIVDRETTEKIFEEWKRLDKSNQINEKSVKVLGPIIFSMSIEHLTLFKALMGLGYKISQRSDINSMNSKNLSVCLSTNLMSLNESEQIPNGFDQTNEYTMCIDFIAFVITHYTLFFPMEINDLKKEGINEKGVEIKDVPVCQLRINKMKKTSKLTDRLFSSQSSDGVTKEKVNVFDRMANKQSCHQNQRTSDDVSLKENKISAKRNFRYESFNPVNKGVVCAPRSSLADEGTKKDNEPKISPLVDLINLPNLTGLGLSKKEEIIDINTESLLCNPELSYNSIDKMVFGEKKENENLPNHNPNEFLEITRRALENEKKLHKEEMIRMEAQRRLEQFPPITNEDQEPQPVLKFTYSEGLGTYDKSNPIYKE